MTGLADRLRACIAAAGPMRLDRWMAACNAHYYATRDPFGAAGDFTTAPEISQMFGELVGAWVADLWVRAGSPAARLVELGPGRGTLMADALRVLRRLPDFAERVTVELVETSPALRAAQAERVPGAVWRDVLDDVPGDRPVIVVANEFFDALPVRQVRSVPLQRAGGATRAASGGGVVFAEHGPAATDSPPPTPAASGRKAERAVALTDLGFTPVWLPTDSARTGEWSEAGEAMAAAVSERLRTRGGAALIIDYGYAGEAPGDSLQAVRGHATADPFSHPGESDLTAHVDFSALATVAGEGRVSGPVAQGVWLARLGIEARAAALKARATPHQAAAIEAALVRLTAPAQMGALFKVMALSAPAWPAPAGFDA